MKITAKHAEQGRLTKFSVAYSWHGKPYTLYSRGAGHAIKWAVAIAGFTEKPVDVWAGEKLIMYVYA